MSKREYARPHADVLRRRLGERRRFIQVVAGPRQVGKTTLVQQVTDAAAVPVVFASADEPTLRGTEWIAQQWEAARLAIEPRGAILVIDEVQKAVGWAESVKRLWDEDTRNERPLKVVLLGDSLPGMAAFMDAFKPKRSLLVGGDGISIEEFLSQPADHWVKP